jgi:AraC-like DNA-binding protein
MAWSKVRNFVDPFPYQSAFRMDVKLFPATRGKFHAELTQVSMNQLWMHSARETLPRVYVGTVKPGRAAIGFLAHEHQPAMRHCGMEVLPGDIIVNDAETMHRRTDANCEWAAMSLPPDKLDAASKAITGREFSRRSHRRLVRPSPEFMSRLLKLHRLVAGIARTTPDLLQLPEVVRALEQKLIHAMVKCLAEGTASEMTAGVRRHEVIVAKFEEFLEENPDKPLYLTEICAAIGVAERTLRASCEEHLGLGPIRYLTLRRMHLVRRALIRADALTATVTRVAMDHGFWELGRFSVAYKALFGETPLESLQGPSNDSEIFRNRPLWKFSNR